MFKKLKTIQEGNIYNFQLKTNQMLMNCKIIENDTDKKLLFVKYFHNEMTIDYSNIENFNLYE